LIALVPLFGCAFSKGNLDDEKGKSVDGFTAVSGCFLLKFPP
jgi:hypothetical protein